MALTGELEDHAVVDESVYDDAGGHRVRPRGPLKMYQLWPLENVPGIGGHFKMYQA
jgi:hypothetical protein